MTSQGSVRLKWSYNNGGRSRARRDDTNSCNNASKHQRNEAREECVNVFIKGKENGVWEKADISANNGQTLSIHEVNLGLVKPG